MDSQENPRETILSCSAGAARPVSATLSEFTHQFRSAPFNRCEELFSNAHEINECASTQRMGTNSTISNLGSDVKHLSHRNEVMTIS